MKSKFSSIWRVVIALVLIFSLGAVFAPAQPVSAQNNDVCDPSPDHTGCVYLETFVNTYLKDGNGDFAAEDTFYVGTCFYVNAAVVNTGDATATNVTATLSLPACVELAACETLGLTKTVAADLEPDVMGEAWWKVCCVGACTLSTITVTPSADASPTVVPGTTLITQRLAAPDKVLVIEIIEYPLQDVFPCTNFGIKATITNISDSTVTGLSGNISTASAIENESVGAGDGSTTGFSLAHPPIVADSETIYLDGTATSDYTIDNTSGVITFGTAPASGVVITADYTSTSFGVSIVGGDPASWSLSDLEPGDSHIVGWTLHCDAPGDVDIKVNARADQVTQDEQIIYVSPPADAYGYVTVHQRVPAQLEVVITSPLTCTEICTECWDDFTVDATIYNRGDVEVTDVIADVSQSPDGSVDFPGLTSKYTTPATIPPGGSATVSFDASCATPDDVTLTVDAQGMTVEGMISGTDSELIHQNEVIATITAITPEDPTVNVCQEFEVIGTFKNCSGQDLTDVTVCIYWDDTTGATITNSVYMNRNLGAGWELIDASPTETLNNPYYYNCQTVDICDCCITDVKWTFQCAAIGPVLFYVKMTKGAVTDDSKPDITVDQEWKAHLMSGMFSYLQDDYGVMEPWEDFTPCQYFHVVMPVVNTGDANAENVVLEYCFEGPYDLISVSGDATPGAGNTVDLGTIPGRGMKKAIFLLHCTGEGEVITFISDLDGIDENTDKAIPVANIVLPPCPLRLDQVPFTVEIINPWTCQTFMPCSNFVVKALITNDSATDLTCVSATVVWVGNASLVETQTETKSLGDLNAGMEHEITWEFHCDGAGDVEIWVEAASIDPKLIAGSDDKPLELGAQPVIIHQKAPADLTVEILSPGGIEVEFESSGDATAEWSSNQAYTGTYSAKLNAGLAANDWAAVVLTPPAGITLADMANITSGWSWWYYIATADFGNRGTSLELRFQGPGSGYAEMTILGDAFVNPTLDAWTERQVTKDTTGVVFGTKEDGTAIAQFPVTGQPEEPIADMVTYMIGADGNAGAWELVQVRPYLGWFGAVETTAYVDDVTIDGTTYHLEPFINTYIATSQDFALTAVITNTGGVPITINTATVTCASATASGPTPSLNWTLAVGGSVTASWTLHCDASDPDTVIQLVVSGTDTLLKPHTASDWVTINQYAAAHLEVQGISAVPTTVNVSENFTVTANIVNTGEADAWEVSAILSVFPEGSARIITGGYTLPVGTLVGHDQESSFPVSWTLHCKVACDTTITITAEGYDEYGWHLKQAWNEWDDVFVLSLESEPGRAIEERFIEDAWVTVKQLESGGLDLGIIKTVDNANPEVYEDVVYTITVTNYGPTSASGVVVTDTIEGTVVDVESAVASQGTYNTGTGVWTVGNMVVGASASLMVTAEVQSLDEYINEATVTCDQPDGNTLNNTDSAVINPSLAINLELGWNFVSWPLIPDYPGIETSPGVLDDLAPLLTNVESVWGNFGPVAGTWDSYDPESMTNTLLEMNDGIGFWIEMLTPGLAIVIEGQEQPDPPTPPRFYEVVGGGVGGYWNVIAFKSTTAKSPDVYLAGIAGKYTIIYGFDDGAYFIVGTLANPFLEPGLAYWIAVLESGNIFP